MKEVLEQNGTTSSSTPPSIFNHDSIFFIGRNLDYAIGLEASLKLKEISYIHSEAYAAGELKHGTISLIEQGTLVIALATYGQLFDKAVSNMIEVQSRGADGAGSDRHRSRGSVEQARRRHHHRAGDPSAAHALPGRGAYAAVRLLRGAGAWVRY